MAVVENAGINGSESSNRADPNAPAAQNDADHSLQHQSTKAASSPVPANHRSNKAAPASDHLLMAHQQQQVSAGAQSPATKLSSNGNGVQHLNYHHHHMNGGGGGGSDGGSDDSREGFKREIRDLEEMLFKLNPMAEEFVPPSIAGAHYINPGMFPPAVGPFGYNAAANSFVIHTNPGFPNGISPPPRRKKGGSISHGKRRVNTRTGMAQRDDVIRRTVYVSEIDHQVTEEQLANLFQGCGQVVDCRVCGDPNSVLRFAFVEFTDEEGARNALSMGGTMLGYYPVRVLPSKTAIAPVNPTFLPRSEDEREMCARTIYCTNIDKKVTQADVKLFFESICGEVYRLRLLGDYQHSTRIAFVEFVMAESAIAALNCSGAVLGSLPIRVSPSKTPVRPRSPRQTRPNMN